MIAFATNATPANIAMMLNTNCVVMIAKLAFRFRLLPIPPTVTSSDAIAKNAISRKTSETIGNNADLS